MFFDHEEGGSVEQQQTRKNQAIMLQTFSPFRLNWFQNQIGWKH